MIVKDRAVTGIGAMTSHEIHWTTIDWRNVKHKVKNLRRGIYHATQAKQRNRVRSLMKLMLRSRANQIESIRRVTQLNAGKKTPGVDGRIAMTPWAREKLIKEMACYQPWKIKPAKRVYIPKANGKKRPLGISCLADRIAQAMVKNTLEPSWEARFETNCYGFRPGRSVQGALEHT